MNERSPSQWGAKIGYDTWTDRPVLKDKIIVHYNGPELDDAYEGPDAETEILRMWEQHHLSKKWRGVAYGWAVGMSGTVYRCRGWNLYGAHTGDLDGDGISENNEGIPVAFLIGGDQPPTEQAIAVFRELRAHLENDPRSTYSVLPLYGHKDVRGGTECPGGPLYALVRDNFGGSNMGYLNARDIQQVLADAGVTDYEGLPIKADNEWGPRTASALKKTFLGDADLSGLIAEYHSHKHTQPQTGTPI